MKISEIDKRLEETPIIEAATVGYKCENIDNLLDDIIDYIKTLEATIESFEDIQKGK